MSAADPIRSTLYLAPELHQALRLKAAVSQRSMSDIVNEALREALRDDQDDLSTARARAEEPAMAYEAFLAQLKADGTI
ncbi:CopG family transcriptional regulator [Piscinibacter sp. Jin2]|uniref:CopG family transcriptional regulator n=1 Tax=Aquariibacter lacus TaxID=2801332 RepID=A0A9X0XFZ8_9BURK|nr:CopG family transcriptional regulator [Piscinibacter lacus]MBL0720251.1 CopG family transcriptional regulator [Piscinibacter lacus]